MIKDYHDWATTCTIDAMKQLNRLLNPASIVVIAVSGFIFLSFATILHYQQTYIDPETVFWSTIEANLQTSSITRYTNQQQTQGLNVSSQSQFVFRPDISVNSLVEIEQQLAVSGQPNQLVQDIRGFRDVDYVRYLEFVNSDQLLQTKFDTTILNRWIEIKQLTTPIPEPLAELVQDSIVGNLDFSVILYGQLPRQDRLFILDVLKAGAYQVNFDNVRQLQVDGRTIYEYDLSVSRSQFAIVLSSYLTAYGYHDLAQQLEPILIEGNVGIPSQINLEVQIDARARRVVKIINQNGDEQHLTAQGVNQTVERPVPELDTVQLEAILRE